MIFFPIELEADFDYSCISGIETSGVYCADIEYLVRYNVHPSFANSPSHDNEFVVNKTVRLQELILCVERIALFFHQEKLLIILK